jgi:CubicO group peptidase (beta-lactamase class C family)
MTNQISEFLQSRIDANDFPSAVYLIAEKGEIVLQDALGFAVVEPEHIEARIDTIYDLASLTKVLVTGLRCARFFNDEELLSQKVSKFFNGFDKDGKQEITIKNLLTHTSGFRAWKPLYLGKNLWSEVYEEKLEYPTNSKVVYSDLNFIWLSLIIEEIHQYDFESIAKEIIFEPLNLQNTFFNPPKELQKRIAASEKGNKFEKQTCIEQGFLNPSAPANGSDKFRDYQIWGEVHDGNCYFMNGVSGHAGLFSTAEEVFKIAQQFLANQTTLLQPETCELFRTNFTPDLNEARSIAFQLAETPDSTASKALSKDSFGHLGFTGTSLWIEPETERIFILLTNRTHAHELPFVNINSIRRKFHELAQDFLQSRLNKKTDI